MVLFIYTQSRRKTLGELTGTVLFYRSLGYTTPKPRFKGRLSMKKTVIIGVPALPSRNDDVNIRSQTVTLGGCAYNVQNVLRLAGLPHVLCSPVGTGLFGDYVYKELAALGIEPFLRVADRDNGYCYCYVEPDGERTFVSYHWAEFTFRESWMGAVPPDEIDGVYVCGIEIEKPTGTEIISYLRNLTASRSPTVYFAPGPRINHIGLDKMEALFALARYFT